MKSIRTAADCRHWSVYSGAGPRSNLGSCKWNDCKEHLYGERTQESCETADPGWQSESGTTRRASARAAWRQYYGVLQAVQRQDQGARRIDRARDHFGLYGSHLYLCDENTACLGPIEKGGRDYQ